MTPEILASIDRLKQIAQSISEAQNLVREYTQLDAAPFVISAGVQDVQDSMRSLSAEFMFRHLQLTSAVAEWNKQAYPQRYRPPNHWARKPLSNYGHTRTIERHEDDNSIYRRY